MAKFNSKFKYMYDAAPASELIAKATHTATFNGTEKVLDKVQGWWNQPQPMADEAFAIAVNVHDLDHTTGDETYTVELEVGPAGFGTSIKTGKLTISAPGQYVILVDMDTLAAMKTDIASMRLVTTLGGTTPSITLNAWIAGQIIDGN